MYAEVSVGDARAGTRQTVFDAYVTFVCLGSNNKPMPIGDLLVTPITRDTQDEAGKGYWDEVEMQRAARKRPQRNFRELCMMCEAMPHEIDKYVQLWHNNRFVSGKPLHEALGMSQTAYGLWAKGELDYAEYLKQYLQGTWR